jgi:hypothetical protein
MSVEMSEKRDNEDVRMHENIISSEKVKVTSIFTIIKRGWK